MDYLEIDGAMGEGGGQVLRTALSLAVITRRPIRIERIRAGRPKPGLMAQHLMAVHAAKSISQAEVNGDRLGSQTLSFVPRGLYHGRYEFYIPTAGATSLVLQTLMPPLSRAAGPSQISVGGGTHVPWSPSFHYLQCQWQPLLRSLGFDLSLQLERAGFYPQGGGLIHAHIGPSGAYTVLDCLERGVLEYVRGVSAVANLPVAIAERQRDQALRRLKDLGVPMEISLRELPAQSKGTMLLLQGYFERAQCCFTALGERGKRAKHVADAAVEEFLNHYYRGGAIDPYLADQLILPLGVIAGCHRFSTSSISSHLLTNCEVARMFLGVDIDIEGQLNQPGKVSLRSAGLDKA